MWREPALLEQNIAGRRLLEQNLVDEIRRRRPVTTAEALLIASVFLTAARVALQTWVDDGESGPPTQALTADAGRGAGVRRNGDPGRHRVSGPQWNPQTYLQFSDERSRPFVDLLARVPGEHRSIVDLGCGPGHLTALMRQR